MVKLFECLNGSCGLGLLCCKIRLNVDKVSPGSLDYGNFPTLESKPFEQKLNYDKVQYSNSNIIASVI